MKTEEKIYLKVPTKIVRNEDFYITADEFLLYARLCYLYFRSYKRKEFTINIKRMIEFLKIKDNRTFKNRFNKLHKLNLIENKITTLPKNNELEIVFNDELYNSYKSFTMMSAEIFNYYRSCKINCYSFRLIMYYKSHINKHNNAHFCYTGYATLSTRLKISNSTIQESNDQLVQNKLIKIKRHKLQPTYEYSELDELVYNRYNNHYYVSEFLH